MARRTHDRLLIILILAVDMLAFLRLDAAQHAHAAHQCAKCSADGRVVADLLGEDIARELQRGFCVGNVLFGIDKRLRELHGVVVSTLSKEHLRQGLHALFLGDHRAGAALLLEGTIDVLQLRKCRSHRQLGAEFLRQLALLLNRRLDLFAALIQAPQVIQTLADFAQLLVVHRAGALFSVARNKGDGIAFIQHFDDVFDDCRLDGKFG